MERISEWIRTHKTEVVAGMIGFVVAVILIVVAIN